MFKKIKNRIIIINNNNELLFVRKRLSKFYEFTDGKIRNKDLDSVDIAIMADIHYDLKISITNLSKKLEQMGCYYDKYEKYLNICFIGNTDFYDKNIILNHKKYSNFVWKNIYNYKHFPKITNFTKHMYMLFIDRRKRLWL